MSIARIALRLAAIEALKGRTAVAGNVLDSEIGGLEVGADGNLRTTRERPFIAVYTDSASAKGGDVAQRGMLVNGATEILFEFGMTAAMTETDPATDETTIIGIGIPATDQAMEFMLDLVARQIGDALADPENAWGQIYQALLYQVTSIERFRSSSEAKGVRLAAQQIRLTGEVVADPVKGAALAPTAALARFFAAAEGVPALEAQVALMQAQLAGTATDWEIVMRRYGLTREEADAMLITPPSGAAEEIDEVDIADAVLVGSA